MLHEKAETPDQRQWLEPMLYILEDCGCRFYLQSMIITFKNTLRFLSSVSDSRLLQKRWHIPECFSQITLDTGHLPSPGLHFQYLVWFLSFIFCFFVFNVSLPITRSLETSGRGRSQSFNYSPDETDVYSKHWHSQGAHKCHSFLQVFLY